MRTLFVTLLLLAVPLSLIPSASASPCPESPGSSCPPPCGPGLQPCVLPGPIREIQACLHGDPSCPLAISTGTICSEVTQPQTCAGDWVCVSNAALGGSVCVRDPCDNAATCQVDGSVSCGALNVVCVATAEVGDARDCASTRACRPLATACIETQGGVCSGKLACIVTVDGTAYCVRDPCYTMMC